MKYMGDITDSERDIKKFACKFKFFETDEGMFLDVN
jgi:hypothetical protein